MISRNPIARALRSTALRPKVIGSKRRRRVTDAVMREVRAELGSTKKITR